jgi:hypothetical protein
MGTSPIAVGVGNSAEAPEDLLTPAQGIAPPAQGQPPGANQAEFVVCDQTIETVMSVAKRRWGEGLSARLDETQRAQALLRGVVYNLNRLISLDCPA